MMKKLLCGLLVLGSLTAFVSERGTCQRPLPWHIQTCKEMEQAILDTTVRIVFHGSIEIDDGYDTIQINGTISHGTVIDGRFLLTHNHFGISLSQIQIYNRHAYKSFTGVSVYRLDGTAVVENAPLDIFTVADENGESVLLDFGTVAGEDIFTQSGVQSAKVAPSINGRLRPYTEIGLIDWDGKTNTRVVWVQIKAIYQENGQTFVQADHFIELGASGGGVFLSDQHIGNNWARMTETDLNTGKVTQKLTLIALNA